jgi:hypothetical protein
MPNIELSDLLDYYQPKKVTIFEQLSAKNSSKNKIIAPSITNL